MNQRVKEFVADQSGAMAVLAALLVVVLLSVSALAVDYGYMAWVRGELQKAADAGALAGARVLGSVANPDWSGARPRGPQWSNRI
jgi:Flp pilus assembly protein TadG